MRVTASTTPSPNANAGGQSECHCARRGASRGSLLIGWFMVRAANVLSWQVSCATVFSNAEAFCGDAPCHGSSEHHSRLLMHGACEKKGTDTQSEIWASSAARSNAILGRHDHECAMYAMRLSAQNGLDPVRIKITQRNTVTFAKCFSTKHNFA